jgi:hypothetical protein
MHNATMSGSEVDCPATLILVWITTVNGRLDSHDQRLARLEAKLCSFDTKKYYLCYSVRLDSGPMWTAAFVGILMEIPSYQWIHMFVMVVGMFYLCTSTSVQSCG